MPKLKPNDLDYLAARLHARRSRLAEAGRLAALCGVRSLGELFRAVYPSVVLRSAVEFQRHAVEEAARELDDLRRHAPGAGGRLLEWMRVRFDVENLKTLVRGLATRAEAGVVRRHLLRLSDAEIPDPASLADADSLRALAERLPAGCFRTVLEEAAETIVGRPRPFVVEALLDHAFLVELLARGARLPAGEREGVGALLAQEADIFHLMLVARGRFHHALEPHALMRFHVAHTAIERGRFAVMLAAPDLATAVARGVGRVVGALPAPFVGSGEAARRLDPAALEALAWRRLLLLANRAFRRNPAGLGAVIGYVVIRRIEVANLITLSEGLRAGVSGEAIRARLIPRPEEEPLHV